jgi:hypothetical protein
MTRWLSPAPRRQLDRLLVPVAVPIRTAIVLPCDAVSLLGAKEAARIRLIPPVLIGPAAHIAAAAAQAGEDLTEIEIVGTAHSQAAADAA